MTKKNRKEDSGNKTVLLGNVVENSLKPIQKIGLKLKKKIILSARTPNQKELFKSIQNKVVTFVLGFPGSGKTFIASIMALNKLLNFDVDKIIFTRLCIEAEGENLGFLPGDLKDKISPYMLPIFDFISDYVERSQLEEMIRKNIIITLPLAYQRGVTFRNAFVLLDEAQNTTPQQMRMFLTRIGENCKVVITGDPNQSDIHGANGLIDAVSRLAGLEDIGIIRFTEEDVFRHPIVVEIEKRYCSDPPIK